MAEKGYWVEIPCYQCVFCKKHETSDCKYVKLNEKKDCKNYEGDL